MCPPPPPPPSSIPFLLPLQMACSLEVAKLICNSCAPYPPPTRLREIKKRALGCCRGLCYWARGNEKVQNAGEPIPNFLGVGLIVFSIIYFSNFKAPPPPHMGSAGFLNIGLTKTCIAIAVPPLPTWEPYRSTKRTTRKCKTHSLEQGV